MSQEFCECDVLVVGSGPGGCTAALYAARAGLHTIMISPAELSGMMAEAPEVGNFPSRRPPLPGAEILAEVREQALEAGAEHRLQPAAAAYLGGSPLQVFGGSEDYAARAVIVATGAWARGDKLPGEQELLGRGVARCVACDGPLFRGQDVLVVGQDDEAAREALALAALARSVRLVTPTTRLKVEPELEETLRQTENLEIVGGLRLTRILGEDSVTGAAFQCAKDGEETLEVQGVFLYLRGAAPATEFLGGAVEADEKGYLLTDELMRTSVPGVYAAGDVRSKPVRQMVVACAEGCMAALAAERDLSGRATMRLDRGQG